MMTSFNKNAFLSLLTSIFCSIVPLIAIFLVGGALAAVICSYTSMRVQPVLIEARLKASTREVSMKDLEDNDEDIAKREIKDLLSLNPFDVEISEEDRRGISSMPEEEKKVFSVDGIKVVGSLPNVAAWLSEKSQVTLVLMDQSYKGFSLKKVQPYSVVLQKDEKLYEVYISYKDEGKSVSSGVVQNNKPSPALRPGKKVEPASIGSEGVVARELVDSLLMNPFNELKRVRLVPEFADGKPVGIKVANIMNGSVLKELGVQKGDVVKSVNGVVIRNMGDVANAINSLMGGNRFEVSVGRGGDDIMLNYVVK